MRNTLTRCLLPGALVLLIISTAGCMGTVKPFVTSLSEVEQNEAIVVGKIVLDPPLDDGDQRLKTVAFTDEMVVINPTARHFRNKVLLLTDRENRRIADPSFGDYGGRIEAELGETFYVRARNEPFYVVRSEIWMNLKKTGMDKLVLPAGYRIDLRPGDRAVYIGTIKYHRDEFFSTEKVELIDEYMKESAAFRKRFGDSIKLRKALARAAR
jgi:hypothetical protein